MTEGAKWLRELRVPIVLVVIATLWATLLLVSGKEISVWGDFRRDVAVRDGYPLDQINDIRFYDSSPYSIWLPSDIFVWESLRRGELPLWDRSQAGGYSPVLNLQNGVLHPIRWATVVVPRELVPSVLVIGGLLLMSLGTFVMMRRVYDLGETSSLLGALVVVLSGYVMSTVHFSGVFLPLVHVPWLVAAYTEWSKWRSTRSGLALAVIVALLALSGHPLMIVVSGLLAATLVGWKALVNREGRKLLWGSLLGLSGILLTAIATLPMVLNLPRLWTYKTSTVEGVSYGLLEKLNMFDALIGLVSYTPYEAELIDGGPVVFHLGAVTTVLLVIGLVVAARSRAKLIVTLLVGAGWLLSAPTPLTVELVSRTPLGFFKPWYLMFLFVFPAAIAVAMGFERLLTIVAPRFRPVVMTVLFAAVVLPGFRPGMEILRARERAPVDSPVLRFLEGVDEPFRIVGLSGQTHVPNVGTITGLEDVRFSSPVHPIRYHEWFQAVAPASSRAFPTATIIEDPGSPLLAAFNVRYVLRATVPGHDVQTFLPRVGDRPPRSYAVDPVPDSQEFDRVFGEGSVDVYARRGVHPRAHFSDRFLVVEDMGEAVDKLQVVQQDPTIEVVEVEGERRDALDGVTPAAEHDVVRLNYPAGRQVSIETSASGPRLLVLHDAWDRGWRATVDGEAADLLPVSVLSRGLVLPPGEHVVEMTFAPYGTAAGFVVTLLAACFGLWIARMAQRTLESS